MDMSPPPSCTYKGTDKTREYLIAVTVIVVVLLVGFFTAFFMLIASNGRSVDNTINNEIGAADPVKAERSITFEMGDDVDHHEKVTVEGDMLTIESIGDGFIAIFDHGRNILVIQNTTSDVCYFTRLENFPEMNMDDMDEMNPIYFKEINGTDSKPTDPDVEVFIFGITEPIASDYISLTNNAVVADLCTDGSSYWVNPKDAGRMRRGEITIGFTIWGFYIDISFRW